MGSEGQGSTTEYPNDEVTVALSTTTEASTSHEASTTREAPLTLTQGSMLGRYVVVEEAGSGGVGVVVRAYDPKLHREVALKLLRARTRGCEGPDDDALLLREAQAMAKLSHPNVLAVYDADTTHFGVFIAMEYVEGKTLRDWLRGEPHPWREALSVMRPAAEGLAAAHRAGLVHRDFKPSNVLVGNDGRVRVMDFGIARWGHEPADHRRPASSSGEPSTTYATLSGAIVGTPAYMAPEQHDGPDADARCDQYAFCLTLAEALCGQRPFAGKRRDELVHAKQAGAWELPATPPVPAWLRRIILRGMEPDPERRWPSMEALLEAIARATRRRRRLRLVAGATLVGLTAAGLSFAVQEDEAGPSCEAEEELVGVWDDAARARVEQSVLATELPLAPDTSSRLRRGLDEYAHAWLAAREDACLATRVRGTQSVALLDLRVGCLARRRRALAAAVEVLSEADRDVVLNAIDTVAALPPIEPCAQPDYLLAAVAPPEDLEVAEQVDAVRDELARAEALRKAGRVDEAGTIVTAALERARVLGYRPLLAEALEASAQVPGIDTEAAEDRLEEAYFTALAAGDLEQAFEAASSLVFTVGYSSGRIDEGLAWERHARAVGDALPSQVTMAIDNNVGALLARRGDAEAALERFERAVRHRREADGARALPVARSLANIGGVLLVLGRLDEGEQELRHSLRLFEEALGPDHPDLGGVLNNLGVVALERDDYDGALEHLRRALHVEEAVFGETHPGVAVALDNIGNVLREQEDYEAALPVNERALALRRASLRPGHPDIAISLTTRGAVLAGLDRIAEAQQSFEEALSMLTEHDNLREYHTTRFLLGAFLWEHHPQGPEHDRGLELVQSSLEATEGSDNLALLREMVGNWRQKHGVVLEADPLLRPRDPLEPHRDP